MKNSQLKIHLLQFASVDGQPMKTLRKLEAMLEKLAPAPGDWLLLPEMWPSGFSLAELERQTVENAFCFYWMKKYAQARRCFLVGSMLEVKRGKRYNSAYVLDDRGRLQAYYRKIHLFRLAQEHLKFSAGERLSVSAWPFGKLGLAICYDLRFPELFRRYAQQNVSLVTIPSAWPVDRLQHFRTLLQARAIENQCFVVGINKVGHDAQGRAYGGHSSVWGPWGEKLGELGQKTGVLSVSLDFKKVAEIRKNYPFLKSRVFD